METVLFLIGWFGGCYFGWNVRAQRAEDEMFEAQRLRDEAWDLAHDMHGKGR